MHLIVRTDGGARGNPGPAAAGVCIEDLLGQILFSGGFFLGNQTNNVAEYEGIIRGLTEARELGGRQITLYCDSELVTKQLNGQYRVKNPGMRVCFVRVAKIREDFEAVEFIHVLRHKNQHADAMVNEALDMGCDVGGVCDVKARRQDPIEIPVIEQLSDKVKFGNTGGHRERLMSRNGVMAELLCLQNGQEGSLDFDGDWASVMVYQGQGLLLQGDESHPLRLGSWLAAGKGEAIRFQAESGGVLVLLITGIH
jgi:ribonuclease HI